MTHDSTGKHAAAPTQRLLFLTQPDAGRPHLGRRGGYTGRRIAEPPSAPAPRGSRLKQLVPLGALLVATTGAVAALALPGDGSDGPSRAAANGSSQPPTSRPAPQNVLPGTVVTPADYEGPRAGKHAKVAAAEDPLTRAGTSVGTAGRHRAGGVPDQPKAGSTQATQPTAQPTAQPTTQPTTQPTAQPGSSAAAPGSAAPTHTPATRPADAGSGARAHGLLGGVVGTVGNTVNGVVGGLLGGGTGD